MWSHCVVTSNFTVGYISTLVDYHPYYRKERCEKIYVLIDFWYSNKDVIYTSLKQSDHFIDAVKLNRLISLMGIKLQLSEFANHIEPNTLGCRDLQSQRI